MEREAEEARTEGKVWELVNRERKRKRKVNRDIMMENGRSILRRY